MFKLAGKVVEVELYRDKDGKSRGCGVIEYDHPVESVQAISMFHDQQLYDRPMTVRMDAMDDNDRGIRYPEGLKNVGLGLGTNGQPLRNVSSYLATNSTISGAGSGLGAGILGAVPPSGLGNLGSALSSIVNTPALAALTSLQSVAGVPSLNNMNDLGLGMNQNNLPNPLSSYGYSSVSNNASNNMMGQGYSSNRDSMFSSDQNMSRDYSSGNSRFDSGNTGRNNSFGMGQNSSLFNNGNQGSSMTGNLGMDAAEKPFSDTVIISNVSTIFLILVLTL